MVNGIVVPKHRPKIGNIVKWAIDIVMLLLTIVSTSIAVAEHTEKEKAQGERDSAIEKQKRTEIEKHELEERLQREKDRLRTLVRLYAERLLELRNALSRHAEAKPEAKAEREKEIVTQATSFVEFVKKWRAVSRELAKLLDGEVDKLEASLATKNLNAIGAAMEVLRANLDAVIPLLDKALEEALSAK
jgi:hypothetical protein